MNTQTTEDYVSFEVAKLLKEKGFNEYCFAAYSKEIGDFITVGPIKNSDIVQEDKYIVTAPTLQMAMKWLREVHGLNVQPCIVRTIDLKKAYNSTIYNNNCEQIKSCFGRNIFDDFTYYEEACEVAIKYCLTNLI